MKVQLHHYAHMLLGIQQAAALIGAMREAIKQDPRVKDAEKRLRWDLLYKTCGSNWVCTELYTYCDDTHIDTALKNIMKELAL